VVGAVCEPWMDGESAYWKYDFEIPQYCWSKYLLYNTKHEVFKSTKYYANFLHIEHIQYCKSQFLELPI
jgi:hypothetical protein